MPGVTAWYGLNRICEPKAGETVLVSAASGAVGSVVGQLAKAAGCRAVGIAGGPEKCAYVVTELGFDACIDHRQHGDLKSMARAIRAAAPKGVDGLFENVGGSLPRRGARLHEPLRPDRALRPHRRLRRRGDPDPQRAHAAGDAAHGCSGFIVGEHLGSGRRRSRSSARAWPTGRIKYRETVAEGLAAAPEAFIGMLRGRNFGKQLVKLA